MYVKKKTGISFTPQEYRKLNSCLTCGKRTDIKKEKRCPECISKDLKFCEICDIVLREGTFKFYSYDTKDYHRDIDIDFKVSKNKATEFMLKRKYPKLQSETLCNDCIGWEDRVKNICVECEKSFKNSRKNYKHNGNMCKKCSIKYDDLDLVVDYKFN